MKHKMIALVWPVTMVAPCAGAWIETGSREILPTLASVAPCAGAWIETIRQARRRRTGMSPPARGRGLKRQLQGLRAGGRGRPLRGGVD